MKISSVTENTNFKGGPLVLGSAASNAFQKLAKWSSPEQRLVIGSTALFLQPLIDLQNKNVDSETRELNASRSISRAIVGTATGFAIRKACIGLATSVAEKGPKSWLGRLLSSSNIENLKDHLKNGAPLKPELVKNFQSMSEKRLQEVIVNYGKVLGTALALGVMLFTNFLVDVPCINKLSKKVHALLFKKKGQEVDPKTEAVVNAMPMPSLPLMNNIQGGGVK